MQQHGLQVHFFFQTDFSEKYIFLHFIFLFSHTTGQSCILKTIFRSHEKNETCWIILIFEN
jgi:hypothetical protein